MKALQFERKPARYAAARAAGSIVPGRGATAGPLRLATDLDVPALPSEEWVTVRPRLAGICGSDLATIDGKSSPYFEPIVSFPFTPGHEVVGDLDDDSRVVLIPVLTCEARGLTPVCAACAADRVNHCERLAFGHLDAGLQTGFCAETGGGWGTRLVAHPSQVLSVPDDLTDEAAVMIEPTACAVRAARAVAETGARSVAVLGSGTLGLLTVAALRHRGDVAGPVVVTAKHPHQRRLAGELGADHTVAPGELARTVRSLTGSFVLGSSDPAAGQLTSGVDCVADCVGSADSVAQALQVVAPGRDVILVGMPGHIGIDLTPLWHRETSLRGCYAYTRDDFVTAIDVVRDADLGRLVSATYPLSRYRDAIEHAANAGRRGAVKVAFDLRAEKERQHP
ncbi:MAG TPA: zinc-binding dehydrogenase [Acidimicrobiales bacterium]|nr:zinc-binding dehydrogenase [Acidimicrobiales bacterium]